MRLRNVARRLDIWLERKAIAIILAVLVLSSMAMGMLFVTIIMNAGG